MIINDSYTGWWWLEPDFYDFHVIYGMSSFPSTNSIIFHDGHIASPTRYYVPTNIAGWHHLVGMISGNGKQCDPETDFFFFAPRFAYLGTLVCNLPYSLHYINIAGRFWSRSSSTIIHPVQYSLNMGLIYPSLGWQPQNMNLNEQSLQMSSVRNHCWLMIMEYYTNQYIGGFIRH